MFYVFLAYGVIWALLSGYMVFLHKRQSALKKEIELLKEMESEL